MHGTTGTTRARDSDASLPVRCSAARWCGLRGSCARARSAAHVALVFGPAHTTNALLPRVVLAALPTRPVVQPETGKLDFTDAVDAMRNVVPTMPRATAHIVISTILGMITEHASFAARSKDAYRCPWGISVRPHPCIGIMRDRPSVWPDVLSAIKTTLEASCFTRYPELDLGRVPYVLYGVKYIDLVSLCALPCYSRLTTTTTLFVSTYGTLP